jgi:hypothetical protein
MNAIECGTCGKTIAADAPSGLCPACLLRTAIEHGSSHALAPFLPKLRYFGDYELLEEIARGGMGVVYRARQVSLDRTVALKMMRPGLLSTEAEIRRFLSEARTAAGLRHPHIVAIHEAGEFEGLRYFSMDYVEGPNLAAIVREGPLAPAEAARYVQILAETVHFAHGKGILHRDLKPSNVLVDGAGRPSITDFGVARRMGSDETGAGLGAVIGTPAYMAPEQASGDGAQVTATGDVYSLGAILYELLTGRPPFRAANPLEIVRMVVDTEPQRPRSLNPAIDARIEAICLRCLAKDPAARFPSAGELADDLKRYLAGDPVNSPRQRSLWPALAAAAVVAVAVLSFLALRPERRILVARPTAAIPIPIAKAPAPTIEVPAPKTAPKTRPVEAKAVPPPTAIAASVSPETGSGYKQLFSFRYPFGEHEFDALGGIELDFGGSAAGDQRHCNILFEPSTGRVALQFNPVGGTGMRVGGQFGTLGRIENSVCQVDLSDVTLLRFEDATELRVAVTFQPSFDGIRTIRSWVFKTPGASRSETTVAGQWTVGTNSKQ